MKNKNIYLRVISLLAPYKKDLLKLAVLMLCVAVGNIYIPLVEQKIIDIGILEQNKETLLSYALLAILLAIGLQIVNFLQSYLQVELNLKFTRELQLNSMNHALRLRMDYIKKDGLLNLINRSGDYIQAISDISGEEVVSAVFQGFKLIGIVTGLFIINWKMSLFILLTLPVRIAITTVIGKRVAFYQEENLKAHKKMHRWEEDIYNSAVEIKLWNLYTKKGNEYNEILKERDYSFKKLNLSIILESLAGEGAQQLFLNLLFILGGILIWRNELTIGGILAFVTYSNLLMEPIGWIANMKITLEGIKPALAEYDAFFAMETEQDEMKDLFLSEHICNKNLELEFRDVSFCYDNRKILNHIDFSLGSGDMVALIGENGAGKSTLLNLLLRLYDPETGTIYINGNDIKNADLYNYRELFSVVMQDPYLFSGDIRSNLFLSDEEAKTDLTKEPLLSFVNRLPDKEYTNIGNNSSCISGGEKQKIALFRSLLKKSRILILDEPTSNYDMDSEEEFHKILRSNNKDITIVITHDPQLLRVMNKILHLKEGSITVYNSYNELMKKEEKYA